MTIETEPIHRRLEFAIKAADAAGSLILDYYQQPDLKVEQKRDLSPVTDADRGAEQMLRERIADAFPRDGLLGEEFGTQDGDNGFRWILDPIDGTQAFIHGVPLFGTLIGLEQEERLVLGVCRFPALDEVLYAAVGQGAWWQIGQGPPRAAHVSRVADISKALVCYTEISGWQATGRIATMQRIAASAGLMRGWSDCYGHMLVATGRADVMLDPLLNEWDGAALVPIVEEAGGHFVGFDGNRSIRSGNGISVNAALKDDVIALLAPSFPDQSVV